MTWLPVDARFDHVAMAVPRIVDALPLYRDLLGGTFYTGGDNPRLGFTRSPARVRWRQVDRS